ncbi:PRE_C2HC domain-containing protein [Trichonephila clavipes]|nr:PRE_C2HC domain-containing protein [Trichonephila clavipes]
MKGLPKDSKTLDIHNDLLDLGFTVHRVSQLTGRITNELLPVFMVTLPRNINNANIFKVNKLSYLTVTFEGYDSKGVTQCYQCQKSNHTASNCHIKPKCLKCGEAHQTADCQIKKVDTMYCVNCGAYGHMANYSKCLLYPKPRKGAVVKPNYSHVINSLVRPNTSFVQAAQQTQATVKPSAPLKMTPHVVQVPITNQTQTQAIRISDSLLFTLDLETILQINSNCVIFGDFNVTRNSWNCSNNSTRGIQHKNFADITNLEIAFPNTRTRYGYNSSNTLDFALISNFNFPYNIESISELSSDHNPVILSFTLTSTIHKHYPRAITTCWSAFSSNLKNHIHISDFSKINSPQSLEEKLTKFTDAVSSAHNSASKPIKNKRQLHSTAHQRSNS